LKLVVLREDPWLSGGGSWRANKSLSLPRVRRVHRRRHACHRLAIDQAIDDDLAVVLVSADGSTRIPRGEPARR
jgi:hypothetical protein